MLAKNILNFCTKIKNFLLIIFAFVFPISLAAANILLGILTFCWILEGNWKFKFKKIKNNKLIWIIYLIPFILGVSTLLSSSSTNGFLVSSGYKNEYQFIFKHFLWLNTLFLILITSEVDTKKLLSSFLLGMFFSEVVSYLIFFHLIDINFFKNLGLLSRGVKYYDPSPFMNHTFYSLFLAVSILIILDNLKNFKGLFKILAIIFLISATINLFINGGRTGQIAFVIGTIIYIVFYYKKFIYFLVSIFLISGIFFMAFNFSPVFKSRVQYTFNDMNALIKNHNYSNSWGARVGLNIIGFYVLFDNPKNFLLGLGAGDAKLKYNQYANKNYKDIFKDFKDKIHLHNQYLQLWVDGGILAVLMILLYFYFLYKYAPIPLTLAVIIIFAFSCIADVMLYRPKPYILFLFISAVLVKLYSSTYRETSNTGLDKK